MFGFLKRRHLRYRSVEEWAETEGIKTLVHPDNPKLQDRLFHKFGELRNHLWDQHFVHLTPEERRQLEAGQHPSQSHSRMEQARPIFEEFKTQVMRIPYVADTSMGMYHMDRIVFQVSLASEIGWRTWQKDIAQFYRGFEVKVGFPKSVSAPSNAQKALE